MSTIEETELPGIGVRYDMLTSDGQRIGVVHHRGGRREVFICPPGDPDAVAVSLDVSEDEAHSVAEMLGVSPVVKNLSRLQRMVAGLALDWLTVSEGSGYVGRTIGDARIRTTTGVSVVAVLRGSTPIPSPGPELTLEAGDTLVVVGRPEGIAAVVDILGTS